MAQLQVTVVEGRKLKQKDTFSENDAFVQIYLDDKHQKQKTKVIQDSNNPHWNQSFFFNHLYGQDTLHLDIYDEDSVRNEKIGSFTIDLRELYDKGHIDKWYNIPAKLGLTSHGEIHLILDYQRLKLKERNERKVMKRSFEGEEKDDLGERVALACYNQFNLLSSRGKPLSNEWTHLAAFVGIEDNNNIRVLSIGTGTKCLGGDKEERGTQGCLLHDSHAEVIARRCLIRFFYEQMIDGNNSILIKEEKNKFHLNKSFRIYLFVSYPPCGAAASFSDPIKRPKLEHKCVNSSGNELYLKPGKGFATTSLSCTNKINRWIDQGLEGTLLNQLITIPIQLSGLIILTNIDLSSIFKNIPVISIRESFQYGPSSERIRSSSMSLAWWLGLDVSSCVITVDGHPLGQIKRLRHKQEYANPIAKCSLFKLYLQLMENSSSKTTTYAQAKALSSNSLRNQFMLSNPQWITTDPDIFYSFTITPST